jgi:hypothetical protein
VRSVWRANGQFNITAFGTVKDPDQFRVLFFQFDQLGVVSAGASVKGQSRVNLSFD